jgi:hypothetical protein
VNRFYFDCYGPDDQALRLGFGWLVQIGAASGGIVAVPGLGNVPNLSSALTQDAAERLKRSKRLILNGTPIDLATDRIRPPNPQRPWLAVWVDDGQLDKIEAMRPTALCVIPWRGDDIERWRNAHSPVDMRSRASAAGKQKISNPVVERALESLTTRVNLSTGLGHPSDKGAAVELFKILRGGNELWDPDEVHAWAINRGWTPSGANELAEIARGTLEGRSFRAERGGWIENILDKWRAEAEGS